MAATDRLTATRRTILSAALALPAATIAAGLPAAALANTADRTAWDQAFAVMRKAAAAAAADVFHYDRTYDAWKLGRPSMDAIHWREFPFQDRDETARSMDLDKAWNDYLAGEGKWWFAKDADPAKAKKRAALDSIRDFRHREAENDGWHGINEAMKRSDDLGDQLCDAQSALLVIPAPDADALMWKLNHLFGDADPGGFSDSHSMDAITAIIADTSRLLAAGRA